MNECGSFSEPILSGPLINIVCWWWSWSLYLLGSGSSNFPDHSLSDQFRTGSPPPSVRSVCVLPADPAWLLQVDLIIHMIGHLISSFFVFGKFSLKNGPKSQVMKELLESAPVCPFEYFPFLLKMPPFDEEKVSGSNVANKLMMKVKPKRGKYYKYITIHSHSQGWKIRKNPKNLLPLNHQFDFIFGLLGDFRQKTNPKILNQKNSWIFE